MRGRMTGGSDRSCEGFAVDAVDGGFTRRVDLRDDHSVRVAEGFEELVPAISRAAVAVGLEEGGDRAFVHASRARKRGAKLGGMMRVVVDDLDVGCDKYVSDTWWCQVHRW